VEAALADGRKSVRDRARCESTFRQAGEVVRHRRLSRPRPAGSFRGISASGLVARGGGGSQRRHPVGRRGVNERRRMWRCLRDGEAHPERGGRAAPLWNVVLTAPTGTGEAISAAPSLISGAARKVGGARRERFDVRRSAPKPKASGSGGNLQKFIMGARSTAHPDPSVSQPTWASWRGGAHDQPGARRPRASGLGRC